MNLRRFFPLLLLPAALCALLGAAEPTLKKAPYNPFSDQDEIAIGNKFAAEFEEKAPILKSGILDSYLAGVVDKLGKDSRRPDMHYVIHVVNVDSVNAMAIPGGHLYIDRGMLDFVENESELAGVLAHEVGHVAARHSMNALARQAAVMTLVKQAKDAGLLNDQTVAEIVERVGGSAAMMVEHAFNRDEEREADVLGLYNMERAGWTPLGMLTMMERLKQFSGPPNLIAQLMSNHPPTAERANTIKAEMKLAGGANLQENSLSFRAMKLGLHTLPAPVKSPEGL
jgi:predicted Zn-dependent protease